MSDIKATEKTSEDKKTEKSPEIKKKDNDEKKEQSAGTVSKVQHFLSFILLLLIVAVAAFPFISPDKFNELTYKIFYGSDNNSAIIQQPVAVVEVREEPALTPPPSQPEVPVAAEGFTLVEIDEQKPETVKKQEEEKEPEAIPEEVPETPVKQEVYEPANEAEINITEEKTSPATTITETESENNPAPDFAPEAETENLTQDIDKSMEWAQAEHKSFSTEIKKLQEKNNVLEERVTSLEKMLAYSSFDSKRRAFAVIAAMELQKAVLQGKNFQKELDKLNALSSTEIQEKLNSLKSLNNKVKSDYALQQDFKVAMKKVISLPTQNNSDSFWAKVENIFRSLIVIRKTTDTAQDFQSKLNKADKLVNEYLFTDAVAELKNAPTEAQIIFNPWKEEVANKETAKQIINEVLNDSLVNFGVFNATQPMTEKE